MSNINFIPWCALSSNDLIMNFGSDLLLIMSPLCKVINTISISFILIKFIQLFSELIAKFIFIFGLCILFLFLLFFFLGLAELSFFHFWIESLSIIISLTLPCHWAWVFILSSLCVEKYIIWFLICFTWFNPREWRYL